MKRKKLFVCTALALLLSLSGCTSPRTLAEKNESSSRYLNSMDTVMKLTAYGQNREAALESAEKEILRLDQLLSTENENSEIGQLNHSGSTQMSSDTQYLIQRAEQLYDDTDGTFDITIYPLTHLWGFPTKEYHVPTEKELNNALSQIGFDKIHIEANNVILGSGQAIDFGGIAKGYTSHRIMEIFRENGVTSGIVSLGGNIQCLGQKPDGSNWKIGIRDPLGNEGDLSAVVEVADRAVITSGGYERFFEDKNTGIIYRHILDPRTGYPADNGLTSVSIVTEDGTLGDGLSTSLYIMGLEAAIQFWRAHSTDFDAILIDEFGKVYITEGIQNAVSTSKPSEIITLHP